MAYSKTTWVNDGPPALNADNLNKIETGIEDAHTAIAELELAVAASGGEGGEGGGGSYTPTLNAVQKGDFFILTSEAPGCGYQEAGGSGYTIADLTSAGVTGITTMHDFMILAVEQGTTTNYPTKTPRYAKDGVVYPRAYVEGTTLWIEGYNATSQTRTIYSRVLCMKTSGIASH